MVITMVFPCRFQPLLQECKDVASCAKINFGGTDKLIGNFLAAFGIRCEK